MKKLLRSINCLGLLGLFCMQLTQTLHAQSVFVPTLRGPTESTWNFTQVGNGTIADGRLDMASFSKLAPWPMVDGDYFYSGCYDPGPLDKVHPAPDRCFMTIDASDPANPVRLATVPTFDLVNSPSPPDGHIVWSSDYPFPNLPARAPCSVDWNDPEIANGTERPACWDPGWNTHNHYTMNGPGDILATNQERWRAGTDRQLNYSGVKFYDISDRAYPKFLSYWDAPISPPDPETGVYPDSYGTHHFNFDGSFLYLGTYYEGFVGKVLVILDVTDPRNPVEASKWWVPGQKTPEEDSIRDWVQQPSFNSPVVMNNQGKWTKHVGMHYASVEDDIAYLSYHQAGLILLDVSDTSQPRLLSRTDYMIPGADDSNPDIEACQNAAGGGPAACGNTHAAKLLPNKDLLIVADEYFRCPFGHVRIYNVVDPSEPKLLSHYLTPENTACNPNNPSRAADAERFPRRPASSHLGNPISDDIYLMAWYGNGVQAIDVSDPSNPVSAGHFNYRIDRDLESENLDYAGSDTYDVILGQDGYLYVADGTAGLRVIKYTGDLDP
jgi:hypothetical protein